jgi:hypothetical protein
MAKENVKSSVLDSIFNQYESNKTNSSSDFENKVDLTKYFSDKLQQGQNSDEKIIRILPNKDGGSPFSEAYWHEMQVDGKWNKIYCANYNDDNRCPLCEVEEALRLTGNAEDKALAKSYKPKKFYLAKVIDRNKENEGVKFYRFKHNYTNDGVLDKIVPIFKKRGDITDPREGRDLTLTIGRDQNKNSKVTSIQAEDPTILTEDKDKAKLWFNDTSTWKDVYRAKDITYVEIVAKQQKPVWDKEKKCFVSEDDFKTRESVTLDDEIKISKQELSKKSDNKKTETTSKFKLKTYDDEEVTNEESTNTTQGEEDFPF